MRFLETLGQIWSAKDLRKRIILTAALLLVFRIFAHIPLPGVDISGLRAFFEGNQIFGLLDVFSGGAIGRFSLAMLGVGPYITATIVFQLLGMVIPSLEALQKEGEWGRQKLNQYTRILTFPLALLEAFGLLRLLQSQGVIPAVSPGLIFTTLIAAAAGSIFLMWLGEIITESGIGNGISMIIALGIVAGMPGQIQNTIKLVTSAQTLGLIGFMVVFILAVAFIIWMTEAERQVPVSYARRVRAGKVLGGVQSYLPLRVNSAGVIPIIFASSMLIFPGVVSQFFRAARSPWLSEAATKVANFFNDTTYYGILYFIMVILFTFFYTFVVFKPEQIAENLQKQAAFVPGVRPGKETAGFLYTTLSRITLTGAIFLAIVAVLPFVVQATTGITTLAIGGTGILIIISVVIETMRQIRAQMATLSYEGY